MGIYSDGNVYGVSWIMNDENDNSILFFNVEYETKMTQNQIDDVKKEYEKLTEYEKNNIRINFYTKCMTSYEFSNKTKACIIPWNGNRVMLEELFLNGNIRI